MRKLLPLLHHFFFLPHLLLLIPPISCITFLTLSLRSFVSSPLSLFFLFLSSINMSQLNLSPLEMERLIYERTAYATVSTLIHGIIIWDALDSPEWTLIYWPELQALWRRERFPAVPTMFLLFSRLVAFPIMSTSMTVMFGHPHSCAGVYRALLVLYATAVANGCAILVIRCTAIRSSKWPMKTALWLLWTVQTTAWLYASTISTITQIPKTSPYTTTCFKVEDFPSMSWLMYLSLTLFDFVILILTLQAKIKSFREIKTIATFWKGRKEDISQQFFRDTCLSFLVSTAASIVIVAWIYHHRQNQFYTSLMAPM